MATAAACAGHRLLVAGLLVATLVAGVVVPYAFADSDLGGGSGDGSGDGGGVGKATLADSEKDGVAHRTAPDDADGPVGHRAAPDDLADAQDKKAVDGDDKKPAEAAALRRKRAVALDLDILSEYLRYDEIWAFLVDLVQRHPLTARLGTVGFTSEGRRIPVVRISTAWRPNARRPIILIDAGIHAREWISPAMGLYIIQQLLEDPANQGLVDSVDWHIIPLLNPDGYEYTHTTDRMWRKTRSLDPDNACIGVDPNRNFDYNWGVVGVSWDSCKEIYAGPRPFSEPETRALRDYGLAHRNRIKLYVSIHSYGGYAIYPWGFSYTKPADYEDLHEVGDLVKDAVLSAGIQKFRVGNCAELLGDIAAGGSDDWFKAVAGVKYSYTIEMPTDGFITPEEEIADYVVPMFEGFRAFGTFVREMYGRRRVGRSPKPEPKALPKPGPNPKPRPKPEVAQGSTPGPEAKTEKSHRARRELAPGA